MIRAFSLVRKKGRSLMTWQVKKFDELLINELYEILQQRVSIFVVDQRCPYMEIDKKDPFCYHLFKKENNEIIAYLRVIPPGVLYKEASFGRVFVKTEYRGQNLGKEIVNKALEFIKEHLHEKKVFINAQNYLKDFYETFGFVSISDVYLDYNIPHVSMLLNKEEVGSKIN